MTHELKTTIDLTTDFHTLSKTDVQFCHDLLNTNSWTVRLSMLDGYSGNHARLVGTLEDIDSGPQCLDRMNNILHEMLCNHHLAQAVLLKLWVESKRLRPDYRASANSLMAKALISRGSIRALEGSITSSYDNAS